MKCCACSLTVIPTEASGLPICIKVEDAGMDLVIVILWGPKILSFMANPLQEVLDPGVWVSETVKQA